MIFILPAGFRPGSTRLFAVYHEGGVTTEDEWVTIESNGEVTPKSDGGTHLSLDGIAFRP